MSKDTIYRQAAIDALKMCQRHCIDPDDYYISAEDAEYRISALPSAQSNQTICRDCRWLRPNAGTGYCTVWHRDITDPDGYCHKGAGRDGSGKQEARQ